MDFLVAFISLGIGVGLLVGSARAHAAARPLQQTSPWARRLFSPVFLNRTGVYGLPTRRDWRRRGVWLCGVALCAFGLGFLSFRLSLFAAPMSALRLTLEAGMFVSVLLSPLLFLAGLGDVLRSLREAPIRIAADPFSDSRELAAFLEDHAAGWTVAAVWPDFDAVRYDSQHLEEVRAEIAARFPLSAPPDSARDGEALRAWATRLRDATA